MGQAKLRKAEIQALKAQPKFKAHQKGFMPDAGLNSQEGINHYWFQVVEMIQFIHKTNSLKSYDRDGVRMLELSMPVDIMNYEGTEHIAPQTRDGYFASFAFTADQLTNLATQIDKGAQAVRISGTPNRTATSIITGEKFRDIDVVDSWSAGNNSGHMTYMFITDNGMVRRDSKTTAERFKAIANEMRSV